MQFTLGLTPLCCDLKPDSRMLLEELADGLSFAGGEIVEDDVNLLPRRAQGYDLLQFLVNALFGFFSPYSFRVT